MLKIDRQIRNYLLKNGAHESDIHHTSGHYRSYYVTYNQRVADLLDQYEKERLVIK